MSNPAVIKLDEVRGGRKKQFQRFVIEDNIGESMHLHVDNMRIDFTIEEFLEFSKMVRISLQEMDFLGGYSLENFDEHFLKQASVFFNNLESIDIEEVKLSDLQCIEHIDIKRRFQIMKLSNIQEIPSYRYLQGDTKDFLAYGQYNYFNTNNEQRLLKLLESIQKHSYPKNDQYIILFNGQNIIRDGQHRAAVLASLNGIDSTVKVMRFKFKGNKHYVKIYKHNFIQVGRYFAKIVYKKLRNLIRGL